MAKVTPVWPSFITGEISKRIWTNATLDVYKTGLKKCFNFITTPQGSAKRRFGFAHFFQDTTDAAFGKVIPYPIGNEREIAFVMFDEVITAVRWINFTLDPDLGEGNLETYSPTVPGTWLQFGNNLTQTNIPPYGNEIYFLNPNNAPHQAARVGGDPAADFEITEIVFAGVPSEWGAGNWPSVGAFFQGRWWLSGCPDNPATIWASALSTGGSFFDFTQTGQVTPDDSFEITMDHYGAIRWMQNTKNLMVGTDQGEFIITSSDVIVHGTDFIIQQQSAYGSIFGPAERVGNSTVYITPDGRKLREVKYKWEEDAWTSVDLTFAAEHITQDPVLKSVHYQQNPFNILWCLTQDRRTGGRGEILVAATFEKDLGIVGFHSHSVVGDIVSFGVTKYNGTSIPMMIVDRDINGAPIMQFEMQLLDAYQDGYKEIDNLGTPTTAIVGVTHLAGNTVSVLTDGSVHPDIVLDANGDGTLNYPADIVELGFMYDAVLTTLPMDFTDHAGSTPGWLKRWNKIWVRLINSHYPLINGDRPPERVPQDPMDTPINLVEDLDLVVHNLGLDSRGEITIISDKPLPCEISGIFGELTQDRL